MTAAPVVAAMEMVPMVADWEAEGRAVDGQAGERWWTGRRGGVIAATMPLHSESPISQHSARDEGVKWVKTSRGVDATAANVFSFAKPKPTAKMAPLILDALQNSR